MTIKHVVSSSANTKECVGRVSEEWDLFLGRTLRIFYKPFMPILRRLLFNKE